MCKSNISVVFSDTTKTIEPNLTCNSCRSRELYKVFKQMQKVEDFNSSYYRCKKQVTAKSWKTYKPDDTRGDELAIVAWLSSFYDQLAGFLGQEIAWAVQVVDNPQLLVANLLTQTLTSLDPTLQARIKTSLNLDSGSHLVSEFVACFSPPSFCRQ